MKIEINPKNTLWQYLEKEHVCDESDNISDEEWEQFCHEYGASFAETCSEIGNNLFGDYLHSKQRGQE